MRIGQPEDHPSDELLLCHRDGELSERERRRVERHLQQCWQCSARLQHVELALRTVVDAYRSQKYPGGDAYPARVELRRRLSAIVADTDAPSRGRPLWKLAGAAALALSAAAMVYLPGVLHPSAPSYSTASRPRPHPVARPEELKTLQQLPPPSAPAAVPSRLTALLDPAAIEMRAVFALHQLGACRGEALRVEAVGPRVTVRGIVESDERQQQVVRALEDAAPEARVDIQSAAALEAAFTPEFSSYDPSAPAPTLSAGPILAQERLHAYLSQNGSRDAHEIARETTAFANRAFQLSKEAAIEASAIRQLEERWPAPEGLDPPSLALLRTMLAEHLAAAERHLAALQQLLSPLWPDPTLRVALPETSGAGFTPRVLAVHHLVSSFFAGEQLPAGIAPADAPAHLLGRLAECRAALPDLRARLAALAAAGQTSDSRSKSPRSEP